MSQSTLTISSTPHNLYIQGLSEDNQPIIVEDPTLLDPDDYDADNSVLVACGIKRHKFTINGYCDLTDRGTFKAAMKNNTKVYPVIYPGGGSVNIIDSNAYYYITGISGNYQYVNQYYWYTMSFVYGGV